MSYDLFITPKQFDHRAIIEWFKGREHYEVSDVQAFYQNPDTGTYFAFNFELGVPGDDDAAPRPHVAFNLNFFRPHTFALEAEPEVATFIKAFDATIEDPQMEGTASGPYSREAFLNGWNVGNRFAFRDTGRDAVPTPVPADQSVVEEAWRWNHGRAALNASMKEDLFVPLVSWFEVNGTLPFASACIWPHEVSMILPATAATHILLVRQPRLGVFARMGLGGAKGTQKSEYKLVPFPETIRETGMQRSEISGVPVFISPPARSRAVRQLFEGSWDATEIAGIPSEMVCGSDLVALMAPTA
jgi:hypothetical protein